VSKSPWYWRWQMIKGTRRWCQARLVLWNWWHYWRHGTTAHPAEVMAHMLMFGFRLDEVEFYRYLHTVEGTLDIQEHVQEHIERSEA
jgi:hypothetical protein